MCHINKIIGSILLISLFLGGKAQDVNNYSTGAIALGLAVAGLEQAEFSTINPAAASSSTLTLGLNYNNRFLLAELSTISCFTIIPIKKARLIGYFHQFGNTNYRESLFELGATRKFSPYFSMGLSFRYYMLTSPELFQNPQYITFNWGIQYQKEHWGFGLTVSDPFGELLNKQYTLMIPPPCIIRFGARQSFRNLLLSAQISLSDYRTVSLQLGTQYSIKQELLLRLGFQSENQGLSMGLSWVKRKFQLDYAFAYHQYLGFSPSFALLLRPLQ